MIQAVLMDMDGVIVDSERFICQAAIRMFSEHGAEVCPEDFAPFIGAGEDRYIGGVAEKHGLSIDLESAKARTYDIYTEIIKGELRSLSGAREFLSDVRDRSLKVALATSADRVKMSVSLKEIGLPEETFDVTVNGLDVARKKPHPDIYLRAAILLGVPPTACLVVEDAINGVKAAKSAGAHCLALTTSFPAPSLSEADWVCADLSEYPDAALSW